MSPLDVNLGGFSIGGFMHTQLYAAPFLPFFPATLPTDDIDIINYTQYNLDKRNRLNSERKPRTIEITNITGDYDAKVTDRYIGAKLEDAATITLPVEPPDGKVLTIKLEYGAPVGTKKLSIKTQEPSTIDGIGIILLTTPYASITLISSGGNWFKI
jgi:hypothetical protein